MRAASDAEERPTSERVMLDGSIQRHWFTKDEISTALKVLRGAAENEALSEELQAAVGLFNRRQKQRRRHKRQTEQREAECAAAPGSDVSRPEAATIVAGGARDDATFSPVQLAPPHLSRPLYPNPVCFLATWQPGSRRRNLMTISWVTAIDNDGRFFASMNQRRHSSTLLMAHPYLVLSIACAGLETLLKRVGGCSGARADKTTAFDVPICRPGWVALGDQDREGCASNAVSDGVGDDGGSGGGGGGRDGEGSSDDDEDAALLRMASLTGARAAACAAPDAPSAMLADAADAVPSEQREGAAAAVWPVEGELALGAAAASNEASSDAALADAFAVAPGVAHVCAKVTHVRGAHGHYLLTCETLKAFVRSTYWSGKTLERQDVALPPILSFMGSQRFGRVITETDGR